MFLMATVISKVFPFKFTIPSNQVTMSFVLQCVTNIEKHSLGNEFSASSAYNDIKLASLISVDVLSQH